LLFGEDGLPLFIGFLERVFHLGCAASTKETGQEGDRWHGLVDSGSSEGLKCFVVSWKAGCDITECVDGSNYRRESWETHEGFIGKWWIARGEVMKI